MVDGWKKGSWPRGDIVLKLAKELRVSTDFLLGRVDSPLVEKGGGVLDEREVRLIEGMRAADDHTRRLFLTSAWPPWPGPRSRRPRIFTGQWLVPAHSGGRVRPYPRDRQAAAKRFFICAWKNVEARWRRAAHHHRAGGRSARHGAGQVHRRAVTHRPGRGRLDDRRRVGRGFLRSR